MVSHPRALILEEDRVASPKQGVWAAPITPLNFETVLSNVKIGESTTSAVRSTGQSAMGRDSYPLQGRFCQKREGYQQNRLLSLTAMRKKRSLYSVFRAYLKKVVKWVLFPLEEMRYRRRVRNKLSEPPLRIQKANQPDSPDRRVG